MDQSNGKSQNRLNMLKSDNPSEVSEALFGLTNEDLNEEVVKTVCGLVSSDDNGVRSNVSHWLINNRPAEAPGFLAEFISSEDIALRNLAGEILLGMKNISVRPLLSFLEAAQNDDDRKFVIDILGAIGEQSATPALIELLNKSENDNVLLACIEALGNMKSVEAFKDLIIAYYKNELFKPNVIEAMGKIGAEEGLEFVISRYHKEDDLTKFSIIESLALLGDPEAFFFLLSELNETDGPLVWPMLKSIYALKLKFNFDIPFDERMKNLILNTLFEADKEYRLIAANLLSEFDDKEIILACLKLYGSDHEIDEIMKPKLIDRMDVVIPRLSDLMHTNPSNIKDMLALVQESYWNNEIGFIESFSELELRNLTGYLTRCLTDADEEIRRIAMELLFKVHPSTALLFSDVMLEDNNVWNKLSILEQVERLDDPEVNGILSQLAEDDDEMVSDGAKSIISFRTLQQISTNG